MLHQQPPKSFNLKPPRRTPIYRCGAWYWEGQPQGLPKPIIYSSAARKIITADDPDFVTWLAMGGEPTKWPHDHTGAITVAALDEVLIDGGEPPTHLAPLAKSQLRKMVNQRVNAALASGSATMRMSFLSLIETLDAKIEAGDITTMDEIAAADWPKA